MYNNISAKIVMIEEMHQQKYSHKTKNLSQI